ncbi:MAG TPA: hypothetical protein VH593_04690 [Ktedonobacteraceae bacterium]
MTKRYVSYTEGMVPGIASSEVPANTSISVDEDGSLTLQPLTTTGIPLDETQEAAENSMAPHEQAMPDVLQQEEEQAQSQQQEETATQANNLPEGERSEA